MKRFKILIPEIIASSVSYEHSEKLMELADGFLKNNSFFSKSITDSEIGRDKLRALMEHWYQGYLKSGRWIDGKK